MSTAYVFDTEAVIAFLYDEPGHDRIAELLEEVEAGDAAGLLSETNASEVYYLIAHFDNDRCSLLPVSAANGGGAHR